MTTKRQEKAGARPEVLLVTGGASGIGAAIFEAAVADGRTVVAFDVDDAALEAARRNFAGAAARAHFIKVDIADEAAVAEAVADVDEGIGPISGLVNSAGIGREAPFLETEVEMLRTILEINLVGTFIVARAAAARMVRRSRGSIVNIASVSGLTGNAGRSAYGASKGGVITLTRVMAVELAQYGVRVNAVAPGPVETPLVARMHAPETRNAWLGAVPQRRYARPDEIVGAVRFLLDARESSFVTGQTIAVDGGFSTAGLLVPEEAS